MIKTSWHQMNWSWRVCLFFVSTLTKTNLYPHVYFAGKNLRYEGDKLCYIFFSWEMLGQLWIDTGWLRSTFQFKNKTQSIHSSLLWINKTSLHTKLSSASCLLLAVNAWHCRIFIDEEVAWIVCFLGIKKYSDSIICSIFLPPKGKFDLSELNQLL